jgi:DNA-binding CsgD family transcriptional regulator
MFAAQRGDTDDLIEREREVALIADALGRAVSGSGSVVVVEGPAGIGKTRLLQVARAMAEERGLCVLRATGGELEGGFAYGVVHQLLDRALAGLTARRRRSVFGGAAGLAAPLLGFRDEGPLGGSAVPIDPSFGIVHGLHWLVANLAAERAVLLELDDAQWADAPSMRFLVYLARRLEGVPALIALAVRSEEAGGQSALVAQLAGTQPALVAHPRALSLGGTAELVNAVLGAASDAEFVAACHAATGGNPYLLRALLSTLREEGILPTRAAAKSVAELGPGAVSEWVLLRLGRIPAPAVAFARAVAVLGGDADLAHATELAELDQPTAVAAIDALTAAEILAPGPSLGFVHPIVRAAIHDDLRPAERGLAHGHAARLLMDAGAEYGRVAAHLLASPPAGDAEVVAVLWRAAREALARGSPDLAVRLLARALAEPPSATRRADVLAELGAAEQRMGSPAAIEHLGRSIASTADPVARAERRLLLARALLAAGRAGEAVEALDAGIADAIAIDREVALRLEAELSTFGLIDVSVARLATDRLERFEHVAGTSPAERVLLSALATRAWARCHPAPEAAELARRALADGRLVAEQTADAPAVYQAIFTLLLADALDEAESALDQVLEDARARGLVVGFAAASSLRAMLASRRGDVAGAEAEARVAIDATTLHGFVTPLSLAFLIDALLARGEVEAAGAALAGAGFGDDFPETAPFLSLLFRRGLLRVAQGREEDGLADLTEVGAREDRLGMASPVTSRRCVAALAHAAAGRREEAARLVAEHLELARRWGTPSSIGVGLRAQGLLGEDGGLERLREAVAMLERSPARLELAQALVDLGAGLRRSGKRAAAREPLRRGLDLARGCGASVLAQRAHEELVLAGARPRRRAFSGIESLTAAERRVARMAAEGMTNRDIAQALFVTVRTVENHLARAYSKLDVHSRAALPAAFAKDE